MGGIGTLLGLAALPFVIKDRMREQKAAHEAELFRAQAKKAFVADLEKTVRKAGINTAQFQPFNPLATRTIDDLDRMLAEHPREDGKTVNQLIEETDAERRKTEGTTRERIARASLLHPDVATNGDFITSPHFDDVLSRFLGPDAKLKPGEQQYAGSELQAENPALPVDMPPGHQLTDPRSGNTIATTPYEPTTVSEGAALVDRGTPAAPTARPIFTQPKTFAPSAAMKPSVHYGTNGEVIRVDPGSNKVETLREGRPDKGTFHYGSNGEVVKVDPATGAVTTLRQGRGSAAKFHFGERGEVVSVNPDTGEITTIRAGTPAPPMLRTVGDEVVSFDPVSGQSRGSVYTGKPRPKVVDPTVQALRDATLRQRARREVIQSLGEQIGLQEFQGTLVEKVPDEKGVLQLVPATQETLARINKLTEKAFQEMKKAADEAPPPAPIPGLGVPFAAEALAPGSSAPTTASGLTPATPEQVDAIIDQVGGDPQAIEKALNAQGLTGS